MSGFLSLIRKSHFQNAKRRAGRLTAPARPNQLRHGLKKPEIACLPTACAETLPFPPLNRVFVLPSRYGMTIVEIRGVSSRIPTHFCVQRPCPRSRSAETLLVRRWIPGLALLARDFAAVTCVTSAQ